MAMQLRSLLAARSSMRSSLCAAALLLLAASPALALPLVVVTSSLPSGVTGVPYSSSLVADSGTLPYTWTIASGALPPGFALTSGTGEIAGTTTIVGAYNFVARVTDAVSDTASRAFTISIACPAITLSPVSLSNAPVNVAYSQALSASGGAAPYTYALTVGALPTGLTLSGAGVLSGTPTSSGTASFTVTATDANGCTGPRAYSLTIVGVPAAATNLAVARTTSGNDGDGTIRLAVTFTPTTYTSSAEVYRARFGGYPRYDDAGGLPAPTPSYPPGSPWVLTPVTASGQTDEPSTRDAYAYVVFLKNAFGQVSPVSNKTAPAPNYALGDVSNGFVAGAGDNLVTDLDISLLGAYYGINGTAITTAGVSYLDVGPTVDFGMNSRPFTDGRIDFEDLIVMATNYGAVSSPAALVAGADAAVRAARGRETLGLESPESVTAGETFEVRVAAEAFGRMQGLSMELAWDPAIAEPVTVASTGWLEGQHGVLWSARPAQFDAVLLGARATGLMGQGTLATVTFRALRAGDPAVRIARVLARDAANRALGSEALSFAGDRVAPSRTLLLAPAPNPAPGASRLTFALAHAGHAELAIYSVDGRRVRTLAEGVFAAGTHGFTWDGRDDVQHRVAPGVYFARLVTAGVTQSKMLVQLQ